MPGLSFVESRSGSLVVIRPQALAVLERHRQPLGAQEAGGVLIGMRRGDHYEITAASTPQVADRASPDAFFRAERGHQGVIDRAWRTSKGLVNYLGEWHTHAEPRPVPSLRDRRSWHAAARRHPWPLVVVIVGQREMYVALQTLSGLRPCAPVA